MYRSSPFRSTMNTNVITALGMCKVCTEAIHSAARKRQDWTCESTCEHENAKTRKREESTCGRENGENGENPKTRKRRKPENGQKCSCFLVFNFSFSGFLGFLVFSVFWFSRFLVFSFGWPHPSGQFAFFMCLAYMLLVSFLAKLRLEEGLKNGSPKGQC